MLNHNTHNLEHFNLRDIVGKYKVFTVHCITAYLITLELQYYTV